MITDHREGGEGGLEILARTINVEPTSSSLSLATT